MGVPQLWKILRPAKQIRSFTQMSVIEGFERNRHRSRCVVVGVDVSLWLMQCAFASNHFHAESAAFQILLYRVRRLFQAPVKAIYVFDGPGRPSLKRNKKVNPRAHVLPARMQELLDAFGCFWYTAPGEAEAELAWLNKNSLIDLILTDDVDALVFGGTHIITNPDVKADKDNISIYVADEVCRHPAVNLTHGGLILVALLSGGDYAPAGLPGCGIETACAIARTGCGDSLLHAVQSMATADLESYLTVWRDNLRDLLQNNPNGCLRSKKPSLATSLPDTFPDLAILMLYVNPLTSFSNGGQPPLFPHGHPRQLDLVKLSKICERSFVWATKSGIVARFSKILFGGMCLRMLCQCPDDGFNSLDPPPFSPAAVLCLCGTKFSTDAPSLRLYRVEFSVAAASLVAQSSLTGLREDGLSAGSSAEVSDRVMHIREWMPDPIIEFALPELVAKFWDKGGSRNAACAPCHPELILPPTPAPSLKSILHIVATANKEDIIIDLTLDD